MWWFLGGLGVFLLGMKIMEHTLMQYGVPTLKRLLHTYTDKKRKSVVSGTVLACITQSSTIVSVMTVVFVGAGIITLHSGVGVIIGANVGSTLLGLVLGGAMAGSFKLSSFALPMLWAGALGELLFKKKKTLYLITTLILSFGLIFYGISMINTTISAYAADIDLSVINQWWILGYFLIGTLLTALMHSSDTMLILALTFLAQGIITFPEAIAIMIGANIGTTISAIEGSRSGSKEQKQVALSHFLFNVISAAIALPLLYPSIRLLEQFFVLPDRQLRALVIYDVIYNVAGAILFYPFIGKFVRLLQALVPQKDSEPMLQTTHTNLADTAAALPAFRADVLFLMQKIYSFNLQQLSLDPTVVKDSHVSQETATGALVKVDEDNFIQEFKLISTLEETLMQTAFTIAQKQKGGSPELAALSEAIERMVYSAKTLKDSGPTIDELRAIRMPLIDEYLGDFRRKMVKLYSLVAAYMYQTDTPEQRQAMVHMFHAIIGTDDDFLATIGDSLPQEILSSRQLSSLIHVSQALHRSHKAILHTVEVLFPEKLKLN